MNNAGPRESNGPDVSKDESSVIQVVPKGCQRCRDHGDDLAWNAHFGPCPLNCHMRCSRQYLGGPPSYMSKAWEMKQNEDSVCFS